jgi:FkbM family methyltransferase
VAVVPVALPPPPPPPPPSVAVVNRVRIHSILRHMLTITEVHSIWHMLLERHPNPRRMTVMEIGSYDCRDAIGAAKLGFRVFALEPSPKNVFKCRMEMELNPAAARNIEFMQLAASNVSGVVQFNAVGTTGDHVGRNTGEADKRYHDGSQSVNVPAVKGDDILDQNGIETLYVLKIDTQGYDLTVLEGLRQTLLRKKPLYVISELSPTAMRTTHRQNPADLLNLLDEAGYTLYDSRRLYLRDNMHPTPVERRQDFIRPTIDAQAYTDLMEEDSRRTGDAFGQWTDIIAEANLEHPADIQRWFPVD